MSWLGRAAVASSAAALLVPPRAESLELMVPASGMLRVPAGAFTMGSSGDDVLAALLDCQREPRSTECDPSTFANEGPVRKVQLSAYWLDRTEVTVRDYARCVAVGKCRTLHYSTGAIRFDQPALPVSLVAWEEAGEYCAFRGGRLPTEAEFERAARGPLGRKYPWGNLYSFHVSNHGSFSFNEADASDGFAELAPVGSFPSGRTPEGFLDLAGNVGEWTSDRYAPAYSPTDLIDPEGPTADGNSSGRVVRGGSYESAAPWLRGAARVPMDPDERRPTIGFRCAHGDRHGRSESTKG